MAKISRTLDGRSIDKMSDRELRKELRSMMAYAAKMERGAKCFHEDVRSVDYIEDRTVTTVYTCRECNLSWSD